MIKIILFCNAGMSTSLLVKKMMQHAEEVGFECYVEAHATADAADKGKEADVILIGPQVRHELKRIAEMYPAIPVAPIDMMAYGMMNAQAVLDQVKELLESD